TQLEDHVDGLVVLREVDDPDPLLKRVVRQQPVAGDAELLADEALARVDLVVRVSSEGRICELDDAAIVRPGRALEGDGSRPAAEAGAVDWEVGWVVRDCAGIGEVTAEPAELVGPVAAWLLRAIVASGEGAEALRLIGHDEGVDQSIDVPVHDSWQRRQVEPD